MFHQLRIGVLVERRYLLQPQPAGMIAALRALGHAVTPIEPQLSVYDLGNDGWLEDFDLIVARGRSWAVLSLLAWAEAKGIPTINCRAAIAAVHNKADMAVALTTSAVPTPATFFGSVKQLVRRVPCANYPLILKPIFGDNGQGMQVVDRPDELIEVAQPETLVLAQHYLANDGYDLKLYGIGDEVWAVRKPSPLNRVRTVAAVGQANRSASAELLPLTSALHALGHRCADLFGLELYGVDCIQTPDGPVVIEVNEFPTYTGVPDADAHLARYSIQRARHAGAQGGYRR
jgi:ribosomal protein S6--L-glutamate ligase